MFEQNTKCFGNFLEKVNIFDEKSLGNWFLIIFGKNVAKNRALRENIRFLQQFPTFRGGGEFQSSPPGANGTVTLQELLMMLVETITDWKVRR